MVTLRLPIDDILLHSPAPTKTGLRIGSSREGRDLVGYRFGSGPRLISLIAGCHADEPVGPAMLDRLAGWLAGRDASAPLLSENSWWIVPHVNPDGEARNNVWTRAEIALGDGRSAYDLFLYLRHAAREQPGDDIEFGFPRHRGDAGARPENRAVAGFLASHGPFALHATFHGMAFAAGPWFLMEEAWIDRTLDLRPSLRSRVVDMGYRVHDIDRGGEKGFRRIDEGFSTRPDSGAMRSYFQERGDETTAGLFRPSSMEFVRSLGGDPLTLVSEMPLFLLAAEHYASGDPVSPPALASLRSHRSSRGAFENEVRRLGARAMPIEDQMRLQLAFLDEGLQAVRQAGA